jgi:hypothetical protein
VRDRQILNRCEGRPTEVASSAIKVWSKSDQVKRGPSLGLEKTGRAMRPGTYLFWGPIKLL